MQTPVTPPQRRLLERLLEGEAARESPTYRELAAALGWQAVGTVRDHVRALARKGLVSPPAGRARSLALTPAGRRSVQAPVPSPGGKPPHLRGLAAEAVDALGAFLEARRLSPGEVLWREGEAAGSFVVIDRGHVRAYRSRPSGRVVPIDLFGPGEVFGFLPFLDGDPYPATAEAIDEAQVRIVSRPGLEEAVRARPEVALVLLGALARRLRTAFDRIEDLSSRGAVPRVAATLTALLPEGRPHGLAVVELPGPHREVAEALGLSPETLSRALTQLSEAGLVHRLGARRLQVLDPEGLRRSARPSG